MAKDTTATNVATLTLDYDKLGAAIAKALGSTSAGALLTGKGGKAKAVATEDDGDDGLDGDDADGDTDGDDADDDGLDGDDGDGDDGDDEEDAAAKAKAAKAAKAKAAAGKSGPTRPDVQAALRVLQSKTDKATAMKVIKTVGKADGLSAIKPALFQAVIDKAKALSKGK